MKNKKIKVLFRTILLLLLIFYVLAGNSQVSSKYRLMRSTPKNYYEFLHQGYASNDQTYSILVFEEVRGK